MGESDWGSDLHHYPSLTFFSLEALFRRLTTDNSGGGNVRDE